MKRNFVVTVTETKPISLCFELYEEADTLLGDGIILYLNENIDIAEAEEIQRVLNSKFSRIAPR